MFGEKLRAAMLDKGVTAAELSRITGVSPACISLYQSGKAEPRKAKKRLLTEALGIREDPEESVEAFKTTVSDVARAMHCHPDVVKAGLRQGVFPWGYAVKMGVGSDGKENWAYEINGLKFREIEGVEV